MRCKRLMAGLIAFALGASPAIAQIASALVPRIGETAQEFEARQRGIKLTPPSSDIVTIAADRRGHFFLDPVLNGRPTRMVVDTGASVVALTYEDAERVGARLSPKDFTVRMSTANGTVEGAPFRISEVRIGDLAVEDVEAVVLPKGRLEVSLLGMSFLKRLGGFDISQGRLSLRK
jgi:aspartyl protease family protein